MLALVDASVSRVHVLDAAYRLSSPSVQDPADVRRWEDGSGLAAWAAWRQPWAVLDIELRDPALLGDVLDWGEQRFNEIAAERGQRLDYAVETHEHDDQRIAALESRGFTRQRAHTLHLTASLDDPPLLPAPTGYTIRPVGTPGGAAALFTDLEACVAVQRLAFGSENMTVAWRVRARQMPGYHPELDLIATGPGGEPAGFCLAWLGDHGHAGQVEPLAVHPGHRRRGLARSLVAYALREFGAFGATIAHIDVHSDNAAAIRVYESAGFRLSHRVLRYAKEF